MSRPRRTSSRKIKSRSEFRKDDLDLGPSKISDQKPTSLRPGFGGFIDRFNALTPSTRMYYVKLLFGAIAGIIVAALPMNAPSGGWLIGFGLAIVVLAIACGIIRFGLKISEDELSNRRLALSGTFSFVVIFLISWAVLWQLSNVDSALVNLILGRS